MRFNTSDVAVCCSDAFTSCSRASASWRFSWATDVRPGLTRVLGFVRDERTRVGTRAFALLRGKITSSARPPRAGPKRDLSESLARFVRLTHRRDTRDIAAGIIEHAAAAATIQKLGS
jgi:hypothetical protein